MRKRIAALVGMLIVAIGWTSSAHALGKCDLVLHWDAQTLSDCIEELQHRLESENLMIQTLQTENRILKGHLCVMAQELEGKSPSDAYALVIEDACAELKARAKKRPLK